MNVTTGLTARAFPRHEAATMADDRAYRVELRFVAEQETYVATSAELGLTGQGATRAAAIEALEQAIDVRMQNAADGEALPKPADVASTDGKFSIQLAVPLARELLFLARTSGTTPEALAAQLVARGLGAQPARPPRSERPAREDAEEQQPSSNESRGERRRDDRRDHRGSSNTNANNNNRGRRGEGYRPDLDNKENFLDYVRRLDKGGPTRNRGGNNNR